MLLSIGLERAAPEDVADHRPKRFDRQRHYLDFGYLSKKTRDSELKPGVPLGRSIALYTLGGKLDFNGESGLMGALNLTLVKVSIASLTIVKIGYLTTKQLW